MGRIAERTSLQDIADALGVNRSTVSLALRRDPRISAATRERVLAKAEELGYRANPYVAAWMQQVRGAEEAREGAVMAFLLTPPEGQRFTAAEEAMLAEARAEAARLGYRTADFVLGPDATTAGRISRVLRARAVRGALVFDPSARLTAAQTDFLARDFATVVLGRCGGGHRFPTVTADLAGNTAAVLRRLAEAGRTRIGLPLTSAGARHPLLRPMVAEFLYFERGLPASRRVGFLRKEPSRQTFADWVRREEPDAILSPGALELRWLHDMGVRVPGEIAYAAVGVETCPGVAGMDSNGPQISRVAVALLGQQLNRNETGAPDCPVTISIPGRWVDGHTFPGRGGVTENRVGPAVGSN